MTGARTVYIATLVTAGAGVGWLIGRSTVWIAVGAIMGLGAALLVVVFQVRPVVAVPVTLGAGIGAYVGGAIVHVLCDPTGCPAFEATAATLTGIGALVGIGMVVALATRSFDEYRDAVASGRKPPRTGCDTDAE